MHICSFTNVCSDHIYIYIYLYLCLPLIEDIYDFECPDYKRVGNDTRNGAIDKINIKNGQILI